MLTQRLRRLERDGFLTRTYHRDMPPRVEYECTPLALSLSGVFQAVGAWPDTHLDEVLTARRRFDGEDRADDLGHTDTVRAGTS